MDPYIVLGAPRRCTHRQVKEIFRERVRREHPDHGGDEQKFILVCEAYRQIVADLDGAVDSASPERAAHQNFSEQSAHENLIDLLQKVSARSDTEEARSRRLRSAGARPNLRGDPGAAIAGAVALMIFVVEVVMALLN